jgi:hypothetical protein
MFVKYLIQKVQNVLKFDFFGFNFKNILLWLKKSKISEIMVANPDFFLDPD